jgi:hypothetical protein
LADREVAFSVKNSLIEKTARHIVIPAGIRVAGPKGFLTRKPSPVLKRDRLLDVGTNVESDLQGRSMATALELFAQKAFHRFQVGNGDARLGKPRTQQR